MNKEELYNYMIEYSYIETSMEKRLVMNILDYAEGMEEQEQYNFLGQMLDIEDRIIRKVFY